jgi:undecaprenyl diphosphate synthase
LSAIYTQDQLEKLDLSKIPKHIAIIPDGNRRWAKEAKRLITEGHHQGANNVITIVKAAKEIGIKRVTIYGFSTENWRRSLFEVEYLMRLIKRTLIEQREEYVKNGVRIQAIGNIDLLRGDILKAVIEAKEATAHNQSIDLVLALNYGGRDEIRRAICAILDDYEEKKVTKEMLTEEKISQYLDTAQAPDPDLLIRTSGESRISNFLLWQVSYAEIVVTDVLWPDFSSDNLLETMIKYQQRNRRRGV